MKTLTVKMEWNELARQWLMNLHGNLIYNFWNCPTVQKAFEGLNKKVAKKFKITIEPMKD